jgi:hypothetical protein
MHLSSLFSNKSSLQQGKFRRTNQKYPKNKKQRNIWRCLDLLICAKHTSNLLICYTSLLQAQAYSMSISKSAKHIFN